jgi:hypothetical protein
MIHMNKLPFISRKDKAARPDRLRRRYFWHKIGDDPVIDWMLILLSSAIVAIALVAVGAYVYADGSVKLSSSSSVAASDNAASRFDQKELMRIIDAFDARAAERVLLDKAYSGPSDPSLP